MKQISVLLIILLTGCQCDNKERGNEEIANNTYLDLLYKRAVRDAMNPTHQEVDTSLVSISYAMDTIINDTAYVKMVSLVQKEWLSDYQTALNDKKKLNITWDGFFTIVPEIKDYFQKEEPYKNTDLQTLRVKQILGLPYQKPYSHFVELWVKLNDVKRPCPDSDPKDTSCLLEFPKDIDATYREWFNRMRFSTYVANDPKSFAFPFTQLGYTYDWGGLKDERGLSEFVVLGKESIKKAYVINIQTISDYLND